MKEHHALPPVLLDVVLEFNAVLTIVVNCAQTIINLAAREYETVLFAVTNDFLENVFLCHFFIYFCYSEFPFIIHRHP